MKQAKFHVGLVQMACSPDPDENLAKAEGASAKPPASGAQIICVQELFRSQYFCQTENLDTFDLAETMPGPTTESFTRLARELNVVLVGCIFERRTAGVYHNTAFVADADGALLGLYRKMHIPDDPRFYEKYYFTPGDLGFRCFDTKYARIAPLVCWDQWYPEGARLAALGGAQILFYPTAIGFHESDAERSAAPAQRVGDDSALARHRQRSLRGQCESRRATRVRQATACSSGAAVSWPIRRDACWPRRATAKRSWWWSATRARIEYVRRNWPFLRDRRIDAYGDIVKRVID